MTPQQQLTEMIQALLETVCVDNLPKLCEMAATPEGKEAATAMILEYCSNTGVSAQTAMAFIEMEL